VSSEHTPVDSIVFDAARIVEVFNRHGVDYLIVGGVGCQIHGARRPTVDFDAVPSFALDNLTRLAAAMRDLGARIRARGLSDEDAKAAAEQMVHADTFRSAQLTTWLTDVGPLDILHDIPGRDGQRRSYDDLIARASVHVYERGVTVRVAALDDIVASKEVANRPKDQEALGELHELLHDDD
jgi:hypothetical protein